MKGTVSNAGGIMSRLTNQTTAHKYKQVVCSYHINEHTQLFLPCLVPKLLRDNLSVLLPLLDVLTDERWLATLSIDGWRTSPKIDKIIII